MAEFDEKLNEMSFKAENDEEISENDVTSSSAAFDEDMEFITEFIPKSAIKAYTREYISVTIMRTAYSRVSLAITFNQGYPAKIPGVELTSPTLPFQLLRNKEKECIIAAKNIQDKRDIGESSGHGLVETIYGTIHSFIHTNLFIPCWKEMKQVFIMCEGTSHAITSTNDKTGQLSFKLRAGEYEQRVAITIPESYPEQGIKVSN